MSSMGPTADRIMDAAFACAQEGPDFAMADVARAAGLSRQAIYLHFPDRKTLLVALALRAKEEHPTVRIEDAPSARAALNALVARGAEIYPKVWPVVRAMRGEATDQTAVSWRPVATGPRDLAERFRNEGALAAHLSPVAAADLLATLLSLSVWKELVLDCGWDSARYKSHITFLAAAAVTR
jgi:AcrR family transcriptional regulator